MNKDEFILMRFLAESNDEPKTQQSIASDCNFSVGKTNKLIKGLLAKELITKEYRISPQGFVELEPYRVENAIILAAGMATRFFPYSLEKPKGLLRCKGEVIIERMISQLREAGVRNIVVVVGYMMEQFLYLRQKYGVQFVVNNEYSLKNTHSSIYAARDHLSNTYICCADNYYTKNLFHPYEYNAYYCSIFKAGTSYVERGFEFDSTGLITGTRKPSVDQWIMYGHAYFDHDFSSRFRPILEQYYGTPGVEQMYWETIYAENVNKLPLHIEKSDPAIILEFDSMDEIVQFDDSFVQNNPTSVFNNICTVLQCEMSQINGIEKVPGGLNNRSFSFLVDNTKYLYRHPGANAEIIDRQSESKAIRVASDLHIDNTLVTIDPENGWKISRWIEADEEFDFENYEHIALLANKLQTLHESNEVIGHEFDYWEEANRLIQDIRCFDHASYEKIQEERRLMQHINDYLTSHPWQKSLCHNDIYAPNLLLSNHNLDIIDWEFAGDSDIGFDICKLFTQGYQIKPDIDYWLNSYFGRATTCDEKKHLLACAAVVYFYWFVWAVYASKNGTQAADYMLIWYDQMNVFRNQFNASTKDEGLN